MVVGPTVEPHSPIEGHFCEGLNNFTVWMRDNGVTIQMQEQIGPYRADFVLRMGGMDPLVVECDGARWHNSREARERDQERDAFMRSRCFRVLRFPGASLWRYPTRCARAALVRLSGLDVEENGGGHFREQDEDVAERIRAEEPCPECGWEDCDHGAAGHACGPWCSHHEDEAEGPDVEP